MALVLLLAACAPRARPAVPRPQPAAVSERDLEALRARRLMVPVAGVARSALHDSYGAPRSGGRTHRAVDILAPRGTPVLAADSGRILRLSKNRLGGITIYAVDPAGRFVYYYAHLARWRSDLAEGAAVARGELLGYVGTSGNAGETPQLHFQVMRRADARRWWDGPPVDPLPFFALDGRE